VSTGPQLVPPTEPRERNWIALAIAAGVIVIIAVVVVLTMERGNGAKKVTPISAQSDAYAANLPITDVKMSESSNLAGGKVTYIDGHITNRGDKTVTGISMQVLFRNVANEVAQNETQSLKWIRTRDPYVDLEPVSAAPLKPGESRDFRLIFDAVTEGWNGVYPELRVVHVDAK
jgi:Tfp pilus assembly major pilin PilA